MSNIDHYSTAAQKRKRRVRNKIFGTALRPRLSVFRSNMHLSLQVIDDEAGKTLVSVTDMGQKSKLKGTKTEKSVELAKKLGAELQAKKIKALVFDRGSYRYHGRVKAVAETLREIGIQL